MAAVSPAGPAPTIIISCILCLLYVFDKSENCSQIGIKLCFTVFDNNEGGRCTDVKSDRELFILISIYLFEFDACFVKLGNGYLALCAGRSFEEIYAVGKDGGLSASVFTAGASARVSMEVRALFGIHLTVFIFLSLAVIPILYGAVIAGYTGIDLRGFAAFGAGEMLTLDIAVILTYRIGRGKSVIRELVILGDLADKVCRCLPIGELFAEERMENSARGIESLKLILNIESREYILRIADGKV